MSLTYRPERARDLARRLEEVNQQIQEAARDLSAVRTASSPLPSLLVVTKFFPASDLAALYQLGVRDFGENRDQEASLKAADLQALEEDGQQVNWSFIGQLQTNKAKSVVHYASEVQSLDRPSLAQALSKAYQQQLARYEAEEGPAPASYRLGGLNCLIQVNLDKRVEASAGQAAWGARGGAAPADLEALAETISSLPGLKLAGLMAVAPLGLDPNQAFEDLYSYSQALQANYPQAQKISAGMSQDLEAAIRWGSTQVRVGSQIMGPRPGLV